MVEVGIADRDSGGGAAAAAACRRREEVWAREVGRTQASFGCWIEYGKGKGKGKRVNEVGRDKKRRV